MKPDNTILRKFHTLIRQAGALANKNDILDGFGVTTAKELTRQQIEDVCSELQNMVQAKTIEAPKEVRAARSRILTLCTDLGVWNGNNWEPLNKFLLNPRIAGKLLYHMDIKELKALNNKLSIMLRRKKADLLTDEFKAINN